MDVLTYDAVIIGAGPAGTATARAIAEAGFRVLIVEEHPDVGRPVHCSGLVTPRTLDVAQVGEDLIINRLKGAVIRTASGAELRLGGDRVRAVVVDRERLDQALADAAQEAGAELSLSSRVQGIERSNHHVVLSVSRGGQRRQSRVHARLLVGADGWKSLVARWMGRSGDAAIATTSLDGVVRHHAEDMAQVFVGRDVAPGWFGWSIPLGDNRVRVGVGCDLAMTASKPHHLLQRLLDMYPETFNGLRPLSYSGGFIPLYRRNGATPAYADRALLVGDAARQVKPTSGGGIYTSLIAGRHAGQTACVALRQGDTSASALAGYERAWRAEFEREFECGEEIRHMYASLSDSQMETLLNLLARKPLQRIISRYGDIDFPSVMFARLALASPAIRGLVTLSHVLPMHWLGILGQGVRKLLSSRPSGASDQTA